MRDRIANILKVKEFKYPWAAVHPALLRLDSEIMENMGYRLVANSHMEEYKLYAHRWIAPTLNGVFYILNRAIGLFSYPIRWVNRVAKPVEFQGRVKE